MLNCAVFFVFGLSGVVPNAGAGGGVVSTVHAYDAISARRGQETASTRNVCLPSGKVPAGYDLGLSQATKLGATSIEQRKLLAVGALKWNVPPGRGGRIGRAGRDQLRGARRGRLGRRRGLRGRFGGLRRRRRGRCRPTSSNRPAHRRRCPGPCRWSTSPRDPCEPEPPDEAEPPADVAGDGLGHRAATATPLAGLDHRGCQRHPDEEQHENRDRPSAPPPNALLGLLTVIRDTRVRADRYGRVGVERGGGGAANTAPPPAAGSYEVAFAVKVMTALAVLQLS